MRYLVFVMIFGLALGLVGLIVWAEKKAPGTATLVMVVALFALAAHLSWMLAGEAVGP